MTIRDWMSLFDDGSAIDADPVAFEEIIRPGVGTCSKCVLAHAEMRQAGTDHQPKRWLFLECPC
jgi:hypothetical protein